MQLWKIHASDSKQSIDNRNMLQKKVDFTKNYIRNCPDSPVGTRKRINNKRNIPEKIIALKAVESKTDDNMT